jgi:metal-responsive CopG/Arc/MetJ family transcriptional regulator
MKLVRVKMPEELWQEAQERADQEDSSVSQIIRRALRAYMNGKENGK